MYYFTPEIRTPLILCFIPASAIQILLPLKFGTCTSYTQDTMCFIPYLKPQKWATSYKQIPNVLILNFLTSMSLYRKRLYFFCTQASSDYEATSMGLSFSPGGPRSISVPVSLTDDTVPEGNEEFAGTLTLPGTAVSGVSLGADEATAMITDNDGKGGLSIAISL